MPKVLQTCRHISQVYDDQRYENVRHFHAHIEVYTVVHEDGAYVVGCGATYAEIVDVQ